MSLSTAPFSRLVSLLKRSKQTTTVIESCCGGLIQSSIMAIPGSSSVFWGGTVSYNTRKTKPLLLNDEELHSALTEPLNAGNVESEESLYVRSKMEHTQRVATAYCKQMGTDYAICESGATGPTFRPYGLDKGFTAIAVAMKDPDSGQVSIVKQQVIRSPHNDRQINMRMFADAAAKLALDAVATTQEWDSEGGEQQRENQVKEEISSLSESDDYHFDRATKLRLDEDQLGKMRKDAKYVVVRGGQSLFIRDQWELMLLSQDEVQSLCDASGATATTTFLGLLNGKDAFFGADLIGGNFDNDKDDSILKDALGGGPDTDSAAAHFTDTRTGAPLLSSSLHNELVMHATALAQWQRRNKYSPVTGEPNELIHGGTAMKCTGSGALSWPRQDPSMIAAIASPDGEHILLAHSTRHPPKFHTILAGFIEAGETFEQGVARETYEETGVRICKDSVEYVGSQPWPFPQSTMIGFLATAAQDVSQPLNIDEDEIVAARWFHKDEVRAAASVEGATMRAEVAETVLKANPDLPLLIPPKGVIARKLIDTWLDKLPL